MSIKIVTDSSCDLGSNFVKENNIEVLSLILNLDGEIIKDDLGVSLKYNDFYDKLRNGSIPNTSQVNIYSFEEKFKELLNDGSEVLYIGLSSALSGTFNSANMARNNILEENPEAKIVIIDSLSVSMGVGLLVKKACLMRDENHSLEEIIEWIEENKKKINHTILVDDLQHLKRGGRISGSTAAVGSLLNIKPALKIDDNGAIASIDKIKGKKKALKYIADKVKEEAVNSNEQVLYIMHGDALEDAEALRDLIASETKFRDISIQYIGTVIGSHGGPGTIAAIFLGDKR